MLLRVTSVPIVPVASVGTQNVVVNRTRHRKEAKSYSWSSCWLEVQPYVIHVPPPLGLNSSIHRMGFSLLSDSSRKFCLKVSFKLLLKDKIILYKCSVLFQTERYRVFKTATHSHFRSFLDVELHIERLGKDYSSILSIESPLSLPPWH